MSVIMYIAASLCVVVYLMIAALVFRFVYRANEDLKQRKHYKAHPERYGVEPVWVLAIISLLWPLQLIGLLMYIIKVGF